MKVEQTLFSIQADSSITIDLGPLSLDYQTYDSFDDLIGRERYRSGPLAPLAAIRAGIKPGEKVELLNAFAGTIDDEYLEMQEMLLSKAGLLAQQVELTEDGCSIRVERRPDVRIDYEYGLALCEAVTGDLILRCHEFAQEVYYFKDFNYDYEVARQFDLNSDMFAVLNSSGEILAVGRVILRVPGYCCPFMHATRSDGSHYSVPARYRRICEVMGLYREGRQGVVGFKKLMEYLTQYAFYVGHVDSIWTTYDELDTYTGAYYRRKLLMEETGEQLTYRDFGGSWNLIVTDRIIELRDLHERIFRL